MAPDAPITVRRVSWQAWLAASIAAGALALALAWLPAGSTARTVASDLLQLSAAATAALVCWFESRRHKGHVGIGWRLLAVGAGSWAAGQLVWSYYEVVAGTAAPFPGLDDPAYLLLYPFATLGLLLVSPLLERNTLTRGALLLDGAVSTLTAFVLLWPLWLHHLFHEGVTELQSYLTIAYPLGDILLLGLAGGIILRGRNVWRSGLGLAYVGFALIAIADLGWASGMFSDSYTTGGFADAGWVAGFLMLAAAAAAPAPEPVPTSRAYASRIGIVLPLVALVAIIASMFLVSRDDSASHPAWVASVTTLAALAFARQLLSVREVQAMGQERERAERRYRELFEAADEGIAQTSPDGRILLANPALCRMLGYASQAELVESKAKAGDFYADPLQRMALVQQLRQRGVVQDEMVQFKRRDGSIGWMRVNLKAIVAPDHSVQRIDARLTDVTSQRALGRDLQRMQRTLRVMGLSNQAIVQAVDETMLLQRVCDLLVDHGGYRLAWIGMGEDGPERRVHPVTWAGYEAGYMERLRVTWAADDPRGQGPTGRALRDMQIHIAQDILTDPRMLPWREDATTRGYASSCALPFHHNGQRAALMVYANEPDAFSTEEVSLLKELVADLAFGVATLRERKAKAQAEAEKAALQVRYTSLVENAIEGIFQSMPDGRLIFANDAGARMLGYASGQQLVKEVPLVTALYADPGDRKRFLRQLETLGQVASYEIDLLRRDGSKVTMALSANLVKDASGTHIQGLMEDLTQRRAAEKALRSSEARLREAQALAHLGSWELDLVNNVLAWSDETYRLFEIDPRRWGATYEAFLDAIHPDDRDRVGKAYTDSLATRTPFSIEHRLLMKDGRVKYVLERCRTDYAADGKPLRSIGTVLDVTERVRDELRLRESQAMLQETQRLGRIGGWNVELPSGRMTWTDETYAIHELDPTTYHPKVEEGINFYADEDRPKVIAAWSAAVTQGTPYDLELAIVTAKNNRRFVRTIAKPELRGGKVVRVFGLFMDVTERRLAEEARQVLDAKNREVERLEGLNKLRIEFLNAAAHDLKTPLTPLILGMATLRLKGLTAEQKDSLDLMERNINRFQVLIEDMLDASRLQSGRLQLKRKPVDLAPMVQEAAASFQEMIRQAGLQLQVDAPADLVVDADPTKLMQVLMNLVSNAAKYTKAGWIRIMARRDGNQAHISIQDTGLGMDADQLGRLFQPFVRLHEAIYGTAKGTGLGLYICKGIVEAHGGRIWITSEGPGHGSTANVAWPLAMDAPPAPTAPASGKPKGSQAN